MYTIKATTQNIFWNQENGNYPTQEIIDSINFDINVDGINFINYSKATISSENDNLTYIKVEGGKHTLFYFVNNISKRAQNNVNVYDLNLDFYSSLILEWINLNNVKKAFLMRTNIYDFKCLEFTDAIIDAVPKYYTSWNFGQFMFDKNFEPTTGITQFTYLNVGLEYDTTDIINMHKYYVFASGKNGGFQFIPVGALSTPFNAMQETKEIDFTTTEFEGTFENWKETYTIFNQLNPQENKTIKQGNVKIDPELVSKIESYFDKDFAIIYYQNLPYLVNDGGIKYRLRLETLSTGIEMNYLPYSIKTNLTTNYQIRVNPRYTSWTLDFNDQIYFDNIQVKEIIGNWNSRSTGADIASFLNNLRTVIKTTTVKVHRYIYDESKIVRTKIYNTIGDLDILRQSQEMSNKFIGIFYLPHILQLGNLWEFQVFGGKNFLVINLKAEGQVIKNFVCGSLPFNENTSFYNELNINPYIFRYFVCKYFSSVVNLEYFISASNQIVFGGKMFFSNGIILCNKTELLSVTDSIITYGYQLPVGINNYLNYVNSNMNTIDTSYQIQKQQAGLGIFKSLFGGANSALTSAVGWKDTMDEGKAWGKHLFGSIGGAVGGVLGAVQSGLGLENWKNQTKSQYADYKNSMGNSINMSSASDASNLLYYDDNDNQYTGFEYCSLTNDTIAHINNLIYLYGYPLIEFRNIKEFIDEGIAIKNNAYLQFETDYLNISIDLLFDNFDPYEISIIKQMLITGIRIWGVKPQKYVSKIPSKE